MKNIADTVQKKIGLLISIVGLAVVILNTIYRMQGGYDFFSAVAGISVWAVFLLTLIFITSTFVESRYLKYLQVLSFFAMGILNILDSYNEFYGPGMFFAAWLLMRHYGFLEKRPVLKHTLILILLISMSQLSALIHIGSQRAVYAGFSTLASTLFLSFLIIIIWRDMVKQQKLLKEQNKQLQTNYKTLHSQLKEIEEEQKPYNLKAAKISPAEERVIETLTRYRASNLEIAERLNLAESTVKLHLYNIYNKIGVDNRFAVIDLCKYNFP